MRKTPSCQPETFCSRSVTQIFHRRVKKPVGRMEMSAPPSEFRIQIKYSPFVTFSQESHATGAKDSWKPSISSSLPSFFHFQVRVYPLAHSEHGADDVLVLGTDGLWDVLSNQEVAEAVTCFLANCDPDDQHRQVSSWHNFLSPVLFVEDQGCCLVEILQIPKHSDKVMSLM